MCSVLLAPYKAGLLLLNGQCDNRPGEMTGYNLIKGDNAPLGILVYFFIEKFGYSFSSPMSHLLLPTVSPLHLLSFTPILFSCDDQIFFSCNY